MAVQIPCRPSNGALHLLIDGTGIKAAGEGEWFIRKHGASRPRSRRKVHLGLDAETLEVRAIEITGSRGGDGPMLPELLARVPPHDVIGQITADGASRQNDRPWGEVDRAAAAARSPPTTHQ